MKYLYLFLSMITLTSCAIKTVHANEKMMLLDSKKKYNEAELQKNIKENKDSVQSNRNLKILKNILDKDISEIYSDNQIKIERNFIKPNDSIVLEYFKFQPQKIQNTIYYFLGNLELEAEHSSNLIELSEKTNSQIFVIHYRGYGYSDGEISLKTQFTDNQNFYNSKKSENVGKVIAIGYSLGSLYSTYLATDNQFDRLVLLEPFSNPKESFKFIKKQYAKGILKLAIPFVKITADDYLMKISNTEKLKNFNGNLLIFHTKDDTMLPFTMGESLLKNSISKNKKLISFESGNHGAPFVNNNWQKIIDEINAN